MSASETGLAGIGILLLLLACRMPIGLAMSLVGFAGFSYLTTLEAGLGILRTIFEGLTNYGMSVIPLFVLMGELASYSGLTKKLFNTMNTWVGELPGGLAMAAIVGCACFGAICGSSMATAATMCLVALPEMRKNRYDLRLATGCLAAGGGLGILIPPSAIFLIYGILTEESIGKLFAAGIIPGILQAAMFMVAIYIICKRNPRMGPPGPHRSLREKLKSLTGVMETGVLFLLVIGGLFVGWFTPTEAAAVGAIGALVISLARRAVTWHGFVSSLNGTVRITAMILLIVVGAGICNYFLAVSRLPYDLAGWVGSLPLPRTLIIATICVTYLVLGCFMDSLAMILLTVPIFGPIAGVLGYSNIWFGVIIVTVVEMGLITPPVGLNVYTIKGVAEDVPIASIFRGIYPFLIADVFHVGLLIAFPSIALFLPGLMK